MAFFAHSNGNCNNYIKDNKTNSVHASISGHARIRELGSHLSINNDRNNPIHDTNNDYDNQSSLLNYHRDHLNHNKTNEYEQSVMKYDYCQEYESSYFNQSNGNKNNVIIKNTYVIHNHNNYGIISFMYESIMFILDLITWSLQKCVAYLNRNDDRLTNDYSSSSLSDITFCDCPRSQNENKFNIYILTLFLVIIFSVLSLFKIEINFQLCF